MVRFQYIRSAVLLTIVALCFSTPLWSQAGFQFGQNKVQYKNFDWQVFRTEHFDVHYYPEMEASARDAARMAERGYAYLSQVLNHQIKERIPLILYASMNDFQQTNTVQSMIGSGTRGVTESLKKRVILPISFDESKEAVALNLETRKAAIGYLAEGGAIGIFPGGTVSTSARPFSEPMDPGWRSFAARMIVKSQAQVVPIFFCGHNSRFFQVASHLHQTLRVGLLIKEFRARVNKPVEVVIGKPIPRDALQPLCGDARAMMDFLRKETYALSPVPVRDLGYGFEFEDRYRH